MHLTLTQLSATNSTPVKFWFYSLHNPYYQSQKRIESVVPWAIWTHTQSTRMDGYHSSVLKELADVIMRLFTIKFERFWRLGKVPYDQEKPKCSDRYEKRLKTIQEITSCSDSLQPLGKSWSKSSLKSYLGTWRGRWWLGIASIDLPWIY